MADVTETELPGVGVRYEFRSSNGETVGVLKHHTGRREIIVYDASDPDRAHRVLDLDADDARTLTDLLGGAQVIEAASDARHPIEGLSIGWVDVPDGSVLGGRSLGDADVRAKTGCTVVAAIRGVDTTTAPGPEHMVRPGDVLVAVGTPEGLDDLRSLLRG